MNEIKTGAKLHEESLVRDAIAKEIYKKMELRKWCIEQGIAATPTGSTFMEAAQATYDFVTKE